MMQPDPPPAFDVPIPAAGSADPHYADLRRLATAGALHHLRVPVVLDLRDHVVLAGAIGLALGSTDPIADGAEEVEKLSLAMAWRWPDQPGFTAAEIVAAPKPFGLRLPKWARLYTAEARINWPLWVAALIDEGAASTPTPTDAASELLTEAREEVPKIAALLGGGRWKQSGPGARR